MENIFRWIKSLFVKDDKEVREIPKEDPVLLEELFKDANEACEKSKFPYSLL